MLYKRRSTKYAPTTGESPRPRQPIITAGRRAVIWPLAEPLSSPGMAYWMVACSVYLYIATSGANVRFCGHIARVGRSVVLAAGHGGGGGLPARMSARRGASGNRCRPAMRRTRSRCAGAGYPGRGDEQRASRGSEHAQHRQVGESHCPVGPGAGSFRHSHRPSSEDTFRGDTPE